MNTRKISYPWQFSESCHAKTHWWDLSLYQWDLLASCEVVTLVSVTSLFHPPPLLFYAGNCQIWHNLVSFRVKDTTQHNNYKNPVQLGIPFALPGGILWRKYAIPQRNCDTPASFSALRVGEMATEPLKNVMRFLEEAVLYKEALMWGKRGIWGISIERGSVRFVSHRCWSQKHLHLWVSFLSNSELKSRLSWDIANKHVVLLSSISEASSVVNDNSNHHLQSCWLEMMAVI